MGFVIHKYLSKSLKAPAPSTKNKNNAGTSLKPSRKNSNGQTVEEDPLLKIPDQAYSSNNRKSAAVGPPTATSSPVAMHRSSNGSRASINSIGAGRRPKMTLNLNGDDSFNRRTSLQHVPGMSHADKQSTNSMQQSFRRASLQNDSTYEREHTNYYRNNGSGDIQSRYGYLDDDESDTIEVFRPELRTQTSSASRGSSFTAENDVAAHLLQENRWFQLELKREKRKYSQLEKKLFGTRDQLAFTNATWIDQLHAAQHKHQEEIFQSKRQAEKAENAVLEKELEEWRETLNKVVEESKKLAKNDGRQKDKTETTTPTSTPKRSPSKQMSTMDSDESTEKIQQLQIELADWKDKHANVVKNSKRIQEVLEHESAEKGDLLRESERRVEWLEAELQTAARELYEDTEYKSNTDEQHQHPILVMNHRSELEERVKNLLRQNAELQRGKSQAYALQLKVRELEETLDKSKESKGLQQVLWTKEIEHLQKESREWEKKAQALDRRLQLQATSRETIQAEYAGRLETLETENYKLRGQLEKRQQDWTHQMNLKQRYIESLKSELMKSGGKPLNDIISATEETLSSSSKKVAVRKCVRPSGLNQKDKSNEVEDPATQKLLQEAQRRERDLLLQVSQLTQNEAKLQQRVQEAEHRVVLFENYLTGKKRQGIEPPLFEGMEAESDTEQESRLKSLPTPTPASTPARTSAPSSKVLDDQDLESENDIESETEQVPAKTPLDSLERASRKASLTSISSASTTTTMTQESRSSPGSSSAADTFSSKSQSLHERLAREKQRLLERRSKLQTAKAVAAAAPDMKTTSEKIRNMNGTIK